MASRRSFLGGLAAVFGGLLFGSRTAQSASKPRRTRRVLPVSTYRSWGFNSDGECASGNLTSPISPAAVSTLPATATVLSCGEGAGTCITSAGEVYVWGSNQLGGNVSSFGSQFNGSGSRPPVTTATKLTYAAAVNAIASANDVGAVYWLRSDHTLWAVGLNQGAWGNGETVDTYHATPVQIASNVSAFCVGQGGSGNISASALYYIDLSGNLWFSGANAHGQAANGTTTGPVFTFAQITALSSVTKVWTNGLDAFALAGGVLKAWGRNQYGDLGIGNTTQQTSPVSVTTLPAAVADILVSQAGWTYFLLTDGRLYTTGYNLDGELGLGNNTNHSTPAQATVGASLIVTALAQNGAGGPFSGAVIAGNKYWATGANDDQQVEYSFTAYNTFQNLITFADPVKSINFVGDSAVFVLTQPSASRVFATLIG